MQLMQRFGCRYSDSYVDGYIEQMVKHKGCCDNVWIPTSYSYPTLEEHRTYADFWKKTAEKLRAAGITVSLQVSNTLGHGDRPYTNCRGLIHEGSPVRVMVGHDGTPAKTCFCPRGEYFREYLATSIAYYAEIRPEYVWVDDDFRAKGHGAVKFACFCDECISAFNAQNGTSFSREALVDEIMHGDLAWREKWIAFTREGLTEIIEILAEAVHRVAPRALFAYQHGAYGSYSGYSLDFVYDAMKKANGGIAPCSRPGGGAYSAHDPNVILHKALEIAYQNSMLPTYVKRRAPEIENLPFNVFGKAPATTALETSLNFAWGNTDMSYSMIMNENEPMEWHGRIFRLFAEHRAYWDRLANGNFSTRQAGIRYFHSECGWKRILADGADFSELNIEPKTELEPFVCDAIPIAYDKQEESVIFLHPETAKDVSEEELAYLLSHNVITDGESIDILQKRGFSLGITCRELTAEQGNMLQERFLPHPVKPEKYDTYMGSIYGKGRKTCYAMQYEGEAEILAEYVSKIADYTPLFEGETYPFGIASMILRTETGGKWAILGYQPWIGNIPTYKRNMLLDIADYISGNALPARLITPAQIGVMPRKNESGGVACVSLLNCTVGKSGEMELLIRNPTGERFTFMSQYDGEQELTYRREGDDYIVNVPSVSAWSVATVFID